MNLHELKKPEGSKKKRKRVGRGPGSGSGTTAGKGDKGQKARTGGKVRRGFEGGQTPLFRRLPKYGFISPMKQEFTLINLTTLQKRDDLDGTETLTKEILYNKGVIRSLKNPLKLLGNGEISKAIKIQVDKSSQAAAEKIKAAGGEVILTQG